jgi:hypothetical protein
MPLKSTILALNPTSYWPLDDAPGSRQHSAAWTASSGRQRPEPDRSEKQMAPPPRWSIMPLG